MNVFKRNLPTIITWVVVLLCTIYGVNAVNKEPSELAKLNSIELDSVKTDMQQVRIRLSELERIAARTQAGIDNIILKFEAIDSLIAIKK